jgi:hypothetical protein
MRNDLPDKKFLDGIRETLDRKADALDEETLLRLRRVRLDALETAGKRRTLFAFPRWLTAGGLATAAVVAVAVSVWTFTARQQSPASLPEEVEVLVIKDHLDLYEDLEFYRWLSADESKGKAR